MKRKEQKAADRRKYLRLNTVFPVEFQLFSGKPAKAVSPLNQGFTRDVSAGGICLEMRELEKGFVAKMKKAGTHLVIYINVPFHRTPLKAKVEPRWVNKVSNSFPHRYLIGLEYIQISDHLRQQIVAYARSVRRRPKLIAASIIALILACGLFLGQLWQTKKGKKHVENELGRVVAQLTESHGQQANLENRLRALNMRYQQSKNKLVYSDQTISSLQDRLAKMIALDDQLTDELITKRIELEQQLQRTRVERKLFTTQLDDLKANRDELQQEMTKLKGLTDARVVRVKLTNGNSLTGELIDLTTATVNLKVGMGSLAIDRDMVAKIESLSNGEKINLQRQWQWQEQQARQAELKRQKFIADQQAKGLVYYNNKWLEKEEAEKLEKIQREKEEQVQQLITAQRQNGESRQERAMLLEALLGEQQRPFVTLEDGRIYVNGELYFIKGVAYGIEYPGTAGGAETLANVPLSLFENDFRMMKRAGINTIRTYQPLSDELLDLAEKYDIMVIENLCALSDNTDFNSRVHLNIFKEQIKRYVLKHKNRKSILLWSVWNDAPWAWGSEGNVVKRYGKEKVNKFLQELCDTVKRYDNTRPVTAANALDIEGEDLGWNFLDVIGLNVYIGGYDWFTPGEARRQIARIDSIKEKYHKPVIIMETGFSTYIRDLNQATVLAEQIKAIGEHTSGVTVFQWADGWQKAGDKDIQDAHIEEHWGIVDGYRKPKSGYPTVSKLFNQIKTKSHGYRDSDSES